MTRLNEGPGRVTFEPVEEPIPLEEPEPPGRWSELLKLALSTPGGQRILNHAVIGAAAVSVLVLYMGHDFLSKRQSTVVAAAAPTVASATDHRGEGDEDDYKAPPIGDETPPGFGPGADGGGDEEDIQIDRPIPRRRAEMAPPPPMFFPNPRVPFDISVSNPDVVYNDETLGSGLSRLSPGKRGWVTRRVLAELRAFIPAMKEARDALRIRGRGAKQAADRAFSFAVQLEKALALVERGSPTDEEFNAVIRNLIASCEHLRFIRNNGVPVAIPDFHEVPNPAYAAWARDNSDRLREELEEARNGGGFR